jgi:putrescine---pyruvate transaminase
MNNFDISYVQHLDRAYHLHPKTPPSAYRENGGTMIVRGEGSAVWDERGKRYIDGVAGLANVNVGYGRREIVEAVSAQMSALSYFHCFTAFSNPAAARLSQKLADIMPSQFTNFFYTSSGSEAIDSAVKLAQLYWFERGEPARRHVISRKAAYHGNSIFASALTGMPEYHDQFTLPLSEVSHIEAPYHFRNAPDMSYDLYGLSAADRLEQEIERIGRGNVAAFIAEPIQASGGCIVPPDSYWPRIREICDRHEILLIVDEVITGFGRLGQWLGETAFGFEGDIVAMAKGISSGYVPMGAVGVGAKVAAVIGRSTDYFMHGFSASGHPAACAAGCPDAEKPCMK